MDRVLSVIVCCAFVATTLAGCLGGPPPPSDTNAQGGTFTTATIGEPESLDPGYDYETAGGQVIQQVYETLVYYDREASDRLTPVLVTELPTLDNGGIAGNGTVYTFHLKPNVLFHDGHTLSANDVKFSLDRPILMNDPNSPAWISNTIKGAETYMASKGTQGDRDAYLAAKGVEVVDPGTVRVTLARPDAAFLFKIAFNQAAIVSAQAFKADHAERGESWGNAAAGDGLPPPAQGDRKAVTRDPWADRNAVGTGPFKLERWVPGDKVILQRFDDYHGSPKPSVERVVIQKVEDLNTRILMLQNRQADDIYVAVSDLPQIEGKPNVRITEDPGFAVGVLLMTQHITDNRECPTDAVTSRADCDFFADLHMRKVFAHAMDYGKFVRDVGKNHLIQLAGIVPKGMFGYDSSIPGYTYDPVLARSELAQSKHPGGFHVKIYYNSGNAVREGAAQLLKQGLEGLSPTIRVDVAALDWSTAMLPAGKKSALAAYFIGWAADYAFPDDYVVPFGHSKIGTYPKWAAFSDPQLDRDIDTASQSVVQTQLLAQYSSIQRHMHDNYSYLFLYQTNNVHVEGDWVSGYFYQPMDSGQPTWGQYKYAQRGGTGATATPPPAAGDAGNATAEDGRSATPAPPPAGNGTAPSGNAPAPAPGNQTGPGNSTGNATGSGSGGG